MFRIKLIAGAGLTVLALSGLGASAPVASANNPCKSPAECYGVLTEGIHRPIKENESIDIVSEGSVIFTGGVLVVNCPQGTLNGSIIVVKGNLQASIAGASFGGAGGCSSSGGPMTLSGGPAPGGTLTETLKTNGKAELSGPLMLTLSSPSGGMRCTYSAKSIKGTFNTDEEPIVIGSKVPKFVLREAVGAGCPKSGTLSSNGWAVSAGDPAEGEGPLVFLG